MRSTATRRRRSRALVAAALCLLAAPASGRPHTDGKTIALFSVGRAADADSTWNRRWRLVDSTIAFAVFMQGFSVVPADTVHALYASIADSMGGIFDTLTGNPDSSKQAAQIAAATRTLALRYGATLRLAATLETMPVYFNGGKATWCGTTEKTGAPGGFTAFAGGSYQGHLPGYTLQVHVLDSAGKTLYSQCGGIQLLAHVHKGQIAYLPTDSVLADTVALSRAVHSALDSLGPSIGVNK